MLGEVVSKITELSNSADGLPATSATLAVIARLGVSAKLVKSKLPANSPWMTATLCMTPPIFTVILCESSTPVTVPLKATLSAIAKLMVAGSSKVVMTGAWVSKIMTVLNTFDGLPARSKTWALTCKSSASSSPVKSKMPANAPFTILTV